MSRALIFFRSSFHLLITWVTFFSISPSTAQAQTKLWTLNDCIQQALKENIQLNQGLINNEINSLNLQQSKGNLIPNFNINDGHSLENGKYLNSLTNTLITQSGSVNNLNLSSSVVLYNGKKNINLINQNKLSVEAGQLDIEKMKNDLMLNVIAAYMQVLYNYEAVKIAQSVIDADTEHVNYTSKYVNAGSLPESTLLQVLAQLATDKSSKVNAENQLMLSKVTLEQLMEYPVRSNFELERPTVNEVNPEMSQSTEEIFETALSILPEVKSVVFKTKISELGLKISKSEVLPKLTLSGSLSTSFSSFASLISYKSSTQMENIGYLQSNPSELVYGPVTTTTENASNYPFLRQFGDNIGQGLSLNLSIPVFNNYLYKTDILKSEIAVRVASLNEHLVKNQLRKIIEQAYTDKLAASKNVIATNEQLEYETKSFKDIEIKFKAGAINATDFFVEKSNYNKAILQNLSAKFDFLFKTKILSFYMGKLTTKE